MEEAFTEHLPAWKVVEAEVVEVEVEVVEVEVEVVAMAAASLTSTYTPAESISPQP